MWLKDPKTNEPSVSLTMLVLTTIVSLVKLLLAGSEFNGFKLADFSGGDFSMIVGVFAALYWGRKHSDNKSNKEGE